MGPISTIVEAQLIFVEVASLFLFTLVYIDQFHLSQLIEMHSQPIEIRARFQILLFSWSLNNLLLDLRL